MLACLRRKPTEGKTEPWVEGTWIWMVSLRPLDPDMLEPPLWTVWLQEPSLRFML